MTNRRDFLKNSIFASFALALPISTKLPDTVVNTKEVDERVFMTNGVERMRISSYGTVGIGTIAPPYELKLSI
jgi:hypothetical protein